MNVLTETEIACLWTAYHRLEAQAEPKEQAWWQLARTLTYVALGTALRRGELLAPSAGETSSCWKAASPFARPT